VLCAGFLCGAVFRLSAADDSAPATTQQSDTDMASVADPDDSAAEASPTPAPAPSASDDTMGADDETPRPKASPSPSSQDAAPAVDIEPPLPEESTNAEEAANGVPLPANPPLQQQFSEWDLAQVESPLFLNAAIDEFNERPILLTGKWSVKPHLSISDYYDGNIFLKSGNEASDFITRVAPGFTMRLGDTDSMFYLVGDYTAGFNYYIEHPSESTVDEDGRIQAQWSMPRTTVGLTINASSDSGQDIDVTDRVRQELYFAGLTTHYDLSDKTSWDVSADYTRSDYNGFISSRQAEGQAFFNYQYSPKTQLGVGGGSGVLMVPGTPQQIFEDANLRATYRATGKLTVIAEGGLELRQFGDGEGSTMTPVFIIEGAWAARPGTTLDLAARRQIFASALLAGQDYTATSLDFTIRQKVTDYVDVSLAAGYVNTDYSATATGVVAVREDNYFYIRPELEWKALTWLSVGIFYEYSQDMSEGGVANSFSRDRGGVDMAILF
jgi:hypothetical protein